MLPNIYIFSDNLPNIQHFILEPAGNHFGAIAVQAYCTH